jgi:hypothetical protein
LDERLQPPTSEDDKWFLQFFYVPFPYNMERLFFWMRKNRCRPDLKDSILYKKPLVPAPCHAADAGKEL